MKKVLLLMMLVSFTFTSCDKEEVLDSTIFNSELSIIQNLNNGVPTLDIVEFLGVESLYGLEFGGGFIFYVDQTDGTIMVAADYSDFGVVAWGDVFEMDTSPSIGDGLLNTQQIVEGNANDNGEGEFDGDNYAFKLVIDLEYRNYDDWFIPSKNSMQAIYDNISSTGLGNFNDNVAYWTSTKEGYSPYVMVLDPSWGGFVNFGCCCDMSGLMIVRKF